MRFTRSSFSISICAENRCSLALVGHREQCLTTSDDDGIVVRFLGRQREWQPRQRNPAPGEGGCVRLRRQPAA